MQTQPKNTVSQEQLVLSHLQTRDSTGLFRTISAMEAIGLYRIYSLSSRISTLQNTHGVPIAKITKFDNTGKRYVRYAIDRSKRRGAGAPRGVPGMRLSR